MRFLRFQQGVKIPNVLIGVFIVIDPFDHTAVLASQLGYRTGANCQNRVGLVHHIHIIETIITRLAPAYILQIAQRFALPVHVVGIVPGRRGGSARRSPPYWTQ